MKRLVLSTLLIIVTSVNIGICQESKLDSLINELNIKHTTRIRVDILNDINKINSIRNDSSKLSFIEEAIQLSNKIDYKKGLGAAYYYLGEFFYQKGEYDSSLIMQQLSISIREPLDNKSDVADNLMRLGSIHELQSNFATAQEYFFKALRIREDENDKLGIANCFNQIAIVYKYQKNYSKAIEYFEQSLALRKELNVEGEIANSLNNIGVIYSTQGEYAKARDYYEKSLETKLKIEDLLGISNGYNNIGITYFYENDFKKALSYYLKSLDYRLKLENNELLSTSYINIGEAYMKLKDYEKADKFLQDALNLSKQTGNKDDQMITYQVMSELYKTQGNFKEGLQYLELSNRLNESIYSESLNSRISEMQTKYEVDKKEREIALLQKENQIISIQEEHNAVIRNTFIVATIIISILIFAVMRSYWEELNNNKLLKKQTVEIERQNSVLKDLSNEKDQLMKIVAHDLRSPLNQIEGLHKLISFESDRLSDQQKDCLNRIKHASEHSKELLSKILSTRSLDSAELKLKLEDVDLKSLIEVVVKDHEIAANNKKINLSFESQENENFNALADKNYTEQVIDNLISNAIKFSSEDNSVNILLKGNNGSVRMEVIDNGPGLTEEDSSKLFGKYQKLSAKPTAGETSTGLGLSIVKKYVDIMNGRVWHEKNPDKGAKFIVELNRTEAAV